MKKKTVLKTVAAAALCAGAVAGGVYAAKKAIWFKNYCKLVDYKIDSVKGTELEGKEDLRLVAHRGFRAMAPENTLPAYEEAGKAGYWGAECDTYRTKDGVWVVHHDPVTTRVTDKNYVVELSSLNKLYSATMDFGHNIDKYPYLKICTLEEYIKKCAEYNMHAVIELKYNRNRQYYGEIIDMLKKYGVDASFIAFDFEDIVDIRKISDYPVFLLVDDIKDSDIEKAKTLENCGISFDCNHESNRDGVMIKKIIDAGLHTACWSARDLETVKLMYNYGVEYITTDCVTY